MNQQTIKFKSGGIDIDAEFFSPAEPVGKQPLVVIAYGTGGMMEPFGPMYVGCREFDKGWFSRTASRLSHQNEDTP